MSDGSGSSKTTCYACGTTVETPAPARCPCGEPRWYVTDATGFEWPSNTESGTWSFSDLLPVDPPSTGIETASGGTPLVRTDTLDPYAGVRVWIKDEGQNPTGSFKDRGTAVGVGVARAEGVERIGTVSHGNMAMSTAAYAAAADLDCVVCVPADISRERLRNIARYDPRIIRVEGDYGRLYQRSLSIGSDLGIRFLNSDTPERVAGQKTTVLEALAQHRDRTGTLPDAVVIPTSSGGHASGAFKGLCELRKAGMIDAETMPRLYLVQAAACAPIARADERGDDAVEPVDPGETVAYSIANPDPPSGTRALYGARETGGKAIAVDDTAIREAKRRLATKAGLTVETSSATAVAGARELSRTGDLTRDDDVICIATGSGFKETVADGDSIDTEVVRLDSLREDLSEGARRELGGTSPRKPTTSP